MRTLQTLIDEASTACKTDRALAKRIGKSPTQITQMRNGQEPISPEAVALLCDVLELDGEETRRLAAEAIVARAKPERKEALRRAFFVSLALGAVVFSMAYGLGNDLLPLNSDVTQVAGLYIVLHLAALAILRLSRLSAACGVVLRWPADASGTAARLSPC